MVRRCVRFPHRGVGMGPRLLWPRDLSRRSPGHPRLVGIHYLLRNVRVLPRRRRDDRPHRPRRSPIRPDAYDPDRRGRHGHLAYGAYPHGGAVAALSHVPSRGGRVGDDEQCHGQHPARALVREKARPGGEPRDEGREPRWRGHCARRTGLGARVNEALPPPRSRCSRCSSRSRPRWLGDARESLPRSEERRCQLFSIRSRP